MSPAPTLRLVAELERAGWSRRRIYLCGGMEIGGRRIRGRKRVSWDTWRRVSILYELAAREGIVPASVLEEIA
jgi:hypothetical protein